MRLNSTITKAILAFGVIFTASASHAQDENPEKRQNLLQKAVHKAGDFLARRLETDADRT